MSEEYSCCGTFCGEGCGQDCGNSKEKRSELNEFRTSLNGLWNDKYLEDQEL